METASISVSIISGGGFKADGRAVLLSAVCMYQLMRPAVHLAPRMMWISGVGS